MGKDDSRRQQGKVRFLGVRRHIGSESSGDSIHNQFVTHELNADFLEEVNAQYSFTTDRIQREISHAPDEVQLVVDTEDDANLEDLELLTTCRSMWKGNIFLRAVQVDLFGGLAWTCDA